MVKKLLLIVLGVLLISLVSAWSVGITYPENDSYGDVIDYFDWNHDIPFENISSCWYSLDNGLSNNTMATCDLRQDDGISSLEASNKWIVWINDTGGVEYTSDVNFWVDSIFPVITVLTPSIDPYYVNSNAINIEALLDETNPLLDVFGRAVLLKLYLGDTFFNQWMMNFDSFTNISTFSYSSLIQGNYTYILITEDTIGHSTNVSGRYILDTVDPYFSNEQNQSDNEYTSGKDYKFDITWEDSLSGIDTVDFVLNSQPYVVTNVGDVYSVIVSDLAAGDYNYTWTAADKAGNTNTTGVLSYTIDKAITILSLDSSPSWDEDYLTNTTVYGSCPPQLTCNLYRNDVLTSEPDIQILDVGSYFYMYNTSGNQNYTSASVNGTLVINKISPESEMNISGTSPIIYGTASDFEGIETNTNDTGCVYELFINGTSVSNPDNLTYAAGTYIYSYNTSGCSNYLAGEVSETLVINKLPQTAILDINETSPIIYGTEIVVNCNGILYREGVNVSDEIGINVLLGAEEYNYSCIIEESQNYSGNIDSELFVVNKADSIVELYLNGSRSNLTIENSGNISINVTLVSGEGSIEIYREGNLIAPGYYIFDSPGTYNITAIYEEGENYSFSYETFFVYIPLPPPSSSTSSGGSCKTIWNCTLWGEWGECINDTQTRTCLEKERVRCGKGIKLKELEKGETRSFCVINTTESIEEPEIIKEPEENPIEIDEEKGFFSGITGGAVGFAKSGTGILTFAVIGVLLISWAVLHFRRKSFR